MNILITGGGGFLGKEFTEYFSREHTVISLPRERLDVRNYYALSRFFLGGKMDVVLHTAARGGKRREEDTFFDLVDNLKMLDSLIHFRHKYKLLLCFCSGAAYDRNRIIMNTPESEIAHRLPEDYYGLSKNILAREIVKLEENIVNLRLFGCFGKYEEDSRFIKNSILRKKDGFPILIDNNKAMDFFFVGDLCKVIEFYMEHYEDSLPKDLNMVYPEKTTLLEIAKHIKGEVRLENQESAPDYTGDGSLLANLGVPLQGLNAGIEEMKLHV